MQNEEVTTLLAFKELMSLTVPKPLGLLNRSSPSPKKAKIWSWVQARWEGCFHFWTFVLS